MGYATRGTAVLGSTPAATMSMAERMLASLPASVQLPPVDLIMTPMADAEENSGVDVAAIEPVIDGAGLITQLLVHLVNGDTAVMPVMRYQDQRLVPKPVFAAAGPAPVMITSTTALGPDALAIAAKQILDNLPAGSGVNPITIAMQLEKGPVPIADTQYGGLRYEEYYHVHPIRDKSGLIDWTGAGTAQPVPGLSQAQQLAAQVLMSGGDTSWSADFHPVSTLQYAAPQNTAPSAPAYSDPAWTPPTQLTEDQRKQLLAASLAPGEYNPDTPAPEVTVMHEAPAAPVIMDALDAVDRAGGDSTQPTQIVDQNGATTAIVQRLADGSIDVKVPTTSNVDVRSVVNTVTGFIDKVAGTLTNIGTEVQKVGNAVKGGAAGAQAGYSAPTDSTPYLIGGGLLIAALLLRRR